MQVVAKIECKFHIVTEIERKEQIVAEVECKFHIVEEMECNL